MGNKRKGNYLRTYYELSTVIGASSVLTYWVILSSYEISITMSLMSEEGEVQRAKLQLASSVILLFIPDMK